MDDVTLKQKITEAMDAPSPDPGTVQRAIVRGQVITAGRAAEAKLEAGGTGGDNAQLLAQGLLGRLAVLTPLPEGDPAQMVWQLAQNPRLQQAAQSPDALQKLRSGALLQQVAAPQAEAAQPQPLEPQAPEKAPQAPERTSRVPGLQM